MNLYLITMEHWPRDYRWDCYDGHVIAADSEFEARSFAARNHGDEGAASWMTANSKIVLIGTAAPEVMAGLVLSSFNAG